MLKVSTPDGELTRLVNASQRQEYLDKGWIIEDTSEVEMMLDEDGNTMWRYKEDTEWNTIAGGSGGTDTYKVKVDGTDTAAYLKDKISAGTNIVINKVNDKMEVSCDIADELPVGGTTGQVLAKKTAADGDVEWVSQGGGSGAGVTVYADLAALKAIDTTAYTDVQTVQVATLGLYKFQPASTLIGDDVNVITPTTGSAAGRWVNQSITLKENNTTTGQAWSEAGRAKPMFGNRFLKTYNSQTIGKKIVDFGSSVMLGHGLASPATQSYPALQLADLNSLDGIDATWTMKNFSIMGETTGSAKSRMLKDIQVENPDVVWIGYSPNNNSLATRTTDTDCNTAIYNFEKDLDKLTKICEQQNVPYIITGVYPKNGYTALAYKYLKQLNINLQLKYCHKYINILGTLDDGTGSYKPTLVQADGDHPSAAGAILIKDSIVPSLFISDRTKITAPILSNSNGVKLGADVSTLHPMKKFYSFNRNKSFARYLEVFKDENVITNKILFTVVPASVAKTVNLIENSSGNIDLVNDSLISVLTTPSTIKMKAGFNKIFINYDSVTGIFELWCNGIKVGISTAITSFYLNFDGIGGGADVALNATGVEYRNYGQWCTKLTADEIITIMNGTMLCGGLEYFNNFSSPPSAFYGNDGGANLNTRMLLQSTLWTSGNRGSNTYTDTEKEKLANINTLGSAVASAATITAPSTIFHVTGTTAISTIIVPYTGFTGKITIIPDGVFTFDTAGNIAETYTSTVNRAIDLVYDGTKWYRV
jgi:lysophospholipase L1-like esterase